MELPTGRIRIKPGGSGHTFNPNTGRQVSGHAGLQSKFQDNHNETLSRKSGGGGRGGEENPSLVYPATRILVSSRCGQVDKNIDITWEKGE